MRSSGTGVSEPVGRLAALQPRLGFLMLIFVGLGGAACERTTDTRLITLAGAGPQGRYFKEVSILSKVLTERMPGVIANGVIGKGMSVGNVKRVAAGRIDGGRCFRFDLENAYRREAHFAQKEPIVVDYDNAKVWMKLGTHLFRVVAVADIKRYSDLVGRSVVIGGRGTGEEVIAERIFKYFGVTRDNTEFLYIERTDGQNALANRQIDAIAFAYSRNNRGHLSPIFAAREIGEEIDFVEPEQEGLERLLASESAFVLDELGEPVFGRPNLRGIGFHQCLLVRGDLPDDLVYGMTKTLFENWDEVEESLPWWEEEGEAELESVAEMKPLPYHPGAERYYRERGVWDRW